MATTTIDSLHSDLLANILRRVDGPTLAALMISSSSTLLRSRLSSSEHHLWAHLCLSTWPSLRHLDVDCRLFFLDSFPFPSADSNTSVLNDDKSLPSSLISAVDLFHGDTPVFSRVVETDASALDWPFSIDALEWKESERVINTAAPARTIEPAELTLSWVVMDPESGRAVNVSSRRPVDIDVHCCSGETMVRFAMVLGGYAVTTVVTCQKEDGQVMEVGLAVEDAEGRGLSWRESLRLLKGAMEGERTTRVAKGSCRYEELLKVRRETRERMARREGLLDWACAFLRALIFFCFVMILTCFIKNIQHI